jgi:hypothetical protein
LGIELRRVPRSSREIYNILPYTGRVYRRVTDDGFWAHSFHHRTPGRQGSSLGPSCRSGLRREKAHLAAIKGPNPHDLDRLPPAPRGSVAACPTEAVGTARAQEHSAQSAICLSTAVGQPRMEWNMSDPRYTDRNNQSRRYGVQGTDGAGFWSWLAPLLTALGLLIGGLIGYNWGAADHERRAQSNPPATTGSAPSQQRPAPETR